MSCLRIRCRLIVARWTLPWRLLSWRLLITRLLAGLTLILALSWRLLTARLLARLRGLLTGQDDARPIFQQMLPYRDDQSG